MTITFLGTGTSQGVPVIACGCDVCRSHDPRDRRLRCAALITDSEGNNILIDIGPDFREQMLRHSVTHLEAILVTHAHRDHVGGIDDIRPLNWKQQCDMELYANQRAIKSIKHNYNYIFEPHVYPGLPEVSVHNITDGTPFEVGACCITPIGGMHKDLPVTGYRIDDRDGSHMAYLTDMNHIDDDEQQKLRELDVMVINSLRKQQHFSHFCLSESLAIIEHWHPQAAYLTHISHEMGFHAEVDATLPSNVHLAYDNLKIDITASIK